MEIPQAIQSLLKDLTHDRRTLHQMPELGLQEFKTAAYIRQRLRDFGVKEIYSLLPTATIAVFRGARPGKTIAFRSDIDGLPVNEETDASFASKIPGQMHACGHDGHMAMLLAFAQYLSCHLNAVCGTLVLVFQPAEEGPGGAQLLLEAGLIEKFAIEEIVGIHLFPEFAEGTIACREHAMMARNGEITIRVQGKSAHGAQPQLGHDAILAAAAIIQGLHTILSRNVSPLAAGVLTFGKITGGEAMNIIAGQVQIEGTMRSFSDQTYQTMVERGTEVVEMTAKAYGCKAIVEFNHMYRVVDNDPQMVAKLREVAGSSFVECDPFMLAEDFSMYQQVIPGLFFFVGTRNDKKGYVYPLHSSRMQFDEKNLLQGVAAYVGLIEALNEVEK